MFWTPDEAYIDLVHSCLAGGKVTTRNARTFRSLSHQYSFNTAPLVSVRKTPWRLALREWEWFMTGSHNINDLHESVRHWWKPWAVKEIWIPYNYSNQFRHFQGAREIDQIAAVVEGIKGHPFSRRNVLTSWNPHDMRRPECPITNCHTSFAQFSVDNDNKLHYHTIQRSADVIVGLGANWIQSWAFLMWMAHMTGHSVGTMTWSGVDCHIYEAHEQVAIKVSQAAEPDRRPSLVYSPTSSEFKADDFSLDGPYIPIVTDKVEMIV